MISFIALGEITWTLYCHIMSRGGSHLEALESCVDKTACPFHVREFKLSERAGSRCCWIRHHEWGSIDRAKEELVRETARVAVTLKGQRSKPQLLVCPHACLSVTSPPPSRRVSPALVSTAIPRRQPLCTAPLLMTQPLVRVELPGRQSEDSPLMRTPTLASTADMQGGLWTCTHPCTHTCNITRALRVAGAGRVKTTPSSWLCFSLMVLMKAFEFLYPALEMPSVCYHRHWCIGRTRGTQKKIIKASSPFLASRPVLSFINEGHMTNATKLFFLTFLTVLLNLFAN